MASKCFTNTSSLKFLRSSIFIIYKYNTSYKGKSDYFRCKKEEENVHQDQWTSRKKYSDRYSIIFISMMHLICVDLFKPIKCRLLIILPVNVLLFINWYFHSVAWGFSWLRAYVCCFLLHRSALLNAGYRVSLSHAAKNSYKTDAPPWVIWVSPQWTLLNIQWNPQIWILSMFHLDLVAFPHSLAAVSILSTICIWLHMVTFALDLAAISVLSTFCIWLHIHLP